jgi:hypothetical protein
MPHTEEQIQEVIREMYLQAESSDWDLRPDEIRSHGARRDLPLPDVKVLVLVAAVVTLIVVGIVIASGSPARRSTADGPTASTVASNPQVVVAPNLVGLSQEQAGAQLTQAGLNLGRINALPSQHLAGTVISQTPAPGDSLRPGGTVDIAISAGPPPGTTRTGEVVVPSLIGLPQTEAAQALAQVGLSVGTISAAPSSNFAAGTVVSESPASGSSVATGSTVELVVSTGP